MVVESLLLTALMSIVCSMEFKKNSPALTLQSSERKHRHITETGLSMLFHSGVPMYLWTEAFHTAVFVINNQPTPLLNHRSPYEILHGTPPAYSSLRAFGCLCYVHISKSIRHKFKPKADCCIFLGYSDDHKGFRCFSLCRRRVFISRHVTFDEATLYDPPSTVPRSQGELSTVPQSQREVPHMLPTVTDSASSAPEITILPLPSSLEKV